MVIPVFQRQYCWTDSQLKNWFTNVIQVTMQCLKIQCDFSHKYPVIKLTMFDLARGQNCMKAQRVRTSLKSSKTSQRSTLTTSTQLASGGSSSLAMVNWYERDHGLFGL